MCTGMYQIHLSVAYSLKFQIELELEKLNKDIVGKQPMFPAVAELMGHTLVAELGKVNDTIDAIWDDIQDAINEGDKENAKHVEFKYGISLDEVPL